MTKEYKQITVTVGEYTTLDFKKAIAEAKKRGITELVFSWSPKTRTSPSEFEARITKVLKTLTDWDFTSFLEDNTHLKITISQVTEEGTT